MLYISTCILLLPIEGAIIIGGQRKGHILGGWGVGFRSRRQVIHAGKGDLGALIEGKHGFVKWGGSIIAFLKHFRNMHVSAQLKYCT